MVDVQRLRDWLALRLWWRRLTHRIAPALVDEAHIQAAAARAKAVRLVRVVGE